MVTALNVTSMRDNKISNHVVQIYAKEENSCRKMGPVNNVLNIRLFQKIEENVMILNVNHENMSQKMEYAFSVLPISFLMMTKRPALNQVVMVVSLSKVMVHVINVIII